MADAVTLVKAPAEKVGDFNKRLLATCQQLPITNAQLAIVDGEPVVTIFSEMVEATEEDVAEAKDSGEELSEGELIPAEDPVFVQVCPLHADSPERAQKTQDRMGTLFHRADGAVTAVLHATGKGVVGVPDKATGKPVMVEKDVFYAMVVFNPVEEEEDGAEGEEAQV